MKRESKVSFDPKVFLFSKRRTSHFQLSED